MMIRLLDFPDDGNFRHEYCEGGVQGAIYASLVGGVAFCSFLVIAIYSEGFVYEAVAVRGSVCLLLFSVALALRRYRSEITAAYQDIAALISLAVLMATVYLLSLGAYGQVTSQLASSPAIIFALFVHYSMLRLSLIRALGVGIVASLFVVMFGAPILLGGNEIGRTLTYLVLTNAVGFFVCRANIKREYALYLERRAARSAEESALQRTMEVEAKGAERLHLLGVIEHEIRQPLAAATAYHGKALSKLKGAESKDLVQCLHESSSALRLVESTLDHITTIRGSLADRDTGDQLNEIDISAMFRQLGKVYSLEAEGVGVDLKFVVRGSRILVRSEFSSLWQILSNLAANAIKYTNRELQRPCVTVSASIVSGACSVVVADNGIGISGGDLEKIWDKEYRIVSREQISGLGLGLFLVGSVVKSLPNHSIRVKSQIGRGTVFRLRLPGRAVNQVAWKDPMKGWWFGLFDPGVIFGAYAIIFDPKGAFPSWVGDVFDDLGIVYSLVSEVEQVSRLVEDSERSVDGVLAVGADAKFLVEKELAFKSESDSVFHPVGMIDFSELAISEGPLVNGLRFIFDGVIENRKKEMG